MTPLLSSTASSGNMPKSRKIASLRTKQKYETLMLFSFAVTLFSLLINRIAFNPLGRINYFRADIFPGVDNLNPSVLLLPDTSNSIPDHREQFQSYKDTDPKNNIPDFQENHQSDLVPTKTAQDHDLNNVMDSVIPPTPENVQLNSSMLTDNNNETKSIDNELVTDTVYHPRYFSLLSYLEYKDTPAIAYEHDSTDDYSPNSTLHNEPTGKAKEYDSVFNESIWYSGLVSIINTKVARAKGFISGIFSLFKVRDVKWHKAFLEYRDIGQKISVMIKYYEDHNPNICHVDQESPFHSETQFDTLTFADDLDSALTRRAELLAEADGIDYLDVHSKVNIPVLVAKGYEILKECVEAIKSQSEVKIPIDEPISAYETLHKAQLNFLPKLHEYQVISHKVLLMIQSFVSSYTCNFDGDLPFFDRVQDFDLFSYTDELDATMSSMTAVLDEIIGYAQSFGQEINVDLVAKGYETLTQSVKSIYYQNLDVINRDQEELNVYADKVLEIISADEACLSDNQCDLADVKSRLLDSLKIFNEKEESIRDQRYSRYVKDFNFRPDVHPASSNFLEFLQQKMEQIRLEKLDRLRKEHHFAGEKMKIMVQIFDSLFLPSDSKVCRLPALKSLLNEEAMFLFDLPSFVNDLKQARGRYWQTGKEIESIENYAWLNPLKFIYLYEHQGSNNRASDIINDKSGRINDLKHHLDDFWPIKKRMSEMISYYDSRNLNPNRGNNLFNKIEFSKDLDQFIEKGSRIFDKINDMGFDLSFAHWSIYQRGKDVVKAVMKQDLNEKTRELYEFMNGNSECLQNNDCNLARVKSDLEIMLKLYQKSCDGYIQFLVDTKEMKLKVDLISSEFFDQIQLAIDRRKTLKLDPLRKGRKFAGEMLKMMLDYYDFLFPPPEIQVCPFPTLETFFIKELRDLFDLPSFVNDLKTAADTYLQTGDEIRSIENDAERKFQDFKDHSRFSDRAGEFIKAHQGGWSILDLALESMKMMITLFALLYFHILKFRVKFHDFINHIVRELKYLGQNYRARRWRFKLWEKLMEHNDVCLFCLDEHDLHDSVIACCGHVFGPECLRPWMAERNSCPMCMRKGPLVFKLDDDESDLHYSWDDMPISKRLALRDYKYLPKYYDPPIEGLTWYSILTGKI